MSKVVNVGYTDTVTTKKEVSIPDLSWSKDFRIKQDGPGTCIMVNLTSPLDRQETIRVAYQDVKDVYANSGIERSNQAITSKGVSIVCQVNDVYSVTDSSNDDYRVDLPVSSHIVVKVPACEYLTADMILDQTLRAVAAMFDTGSTSSDRLNAILRGAVTPSEL